MMTGASKRSTRNRPAAMWSLSLLFFALLAVLPAAGQQAASSDPHHGALLAGGMDQFNGPMATAEFYNFKTQTFSCQFLGGVNSATGACNNTLAQARFFASVAPLPGGGVLIAGGNGIGTTCLNSAEIYNPASGKFECSGLGGADPTIGYCLSTLTDARFHDTATLLQDGRVLIAGGFDGSIVNTAELFDPVAGTFGCS